MGGVCLTLYGFIACSGLKMFKNIDLGENKNLFTVSAILIAGIGGLAIKIPYMIDGNGVVAKAITITSVATALILGIATYAVCNKLEKKDSAVEEEIENKSIVTEAAVQVGVVDTLVETEEAPATEEVAAEAAVETTEEN
jgi:xanthine/uracil permease